MKRVAYLLVATFCLLCTMAPTAYAGSKGSKGKTTTTTTVVPTNNVCECKFTVETDSSLAAACAEAAYQCAESRTACEKGTPTLVVDGAPVSLNSPVYRQCSVTKAGDIRCKSKKRLVPVVK